VGSTPAKMFEPRSSVCVRTRGTVRDSCSCSCCVACEWVRARTLSRCSRVKSSGRDVRELNPSERAVNEATWHTKGGSKASPVRSRLSTHSSGKSCRCCVGGGGGWCGWPVLDGRPRLARLGPRPSLAARLRALSLCRLATEAGRDRSRLLSTERNVRLLSFPISDWQKLEC
jgi:hypothetical protein